VLWALFSTFLKVGAFSFGGGYAVIPTIEYEVSSHGWLTGEEFRQAVSLAGMAPGPVATNTATLIGYKTAGIPGAILSTMGMILPSLIAVLLLAVVFVRFNQNKWFKSTFYGLRPIVTGLMVYAAIHFGFLGGNETGFTWVTLATLALCGGCLLLLVRYKLHPLAVIAAAGAAGVILY
jgi:chromate transporter